MKHVLHTQTTHLTQLLTRIKRNTFLQLNCTLLGQNTVTTKVSLYLTPHQNIQNTLLKSYRLPKRILYWIVYLKRLTSNLVTKRVTKRKICTILLVTLQLLYWGQRVKTLKIKIQNKNVTTRVHQKYTLLCTHHPVYSVYSKYHVAKPLVHLLVTASKF